MTTTIVFVDDEPNVLEGSRRSLRRMGESWGLLVFGGPHAALDPIRTDAVDVVVSDMRMPDMDGAQLLGEVKRANPSAARMILSGYSDGDAVLRSTRVAHQFLTKPCEPDELRQALEKIDEARSAVPLTAIREIVGSVDQLPSVGEVFEELTARTATDDYSIDSLGQIVVRDVGLSAELFRLVNTSFFGLRRQIESVSEAISFLGVDVLLGIVAAHSVLRSDEFTSADRITRLNSHSQATASLAARYRRLEGGTNRQSIEAFTAGLLHEVGALVLVRLGTFPPDQVWTVRDEDDWMNERMQFGADRFSVGSYLLGLWGFSPDTVRAVAALGTDDPSADPTGLDGALTVAHHALLSGRISMTEALADESDGMNAVDDALRDVAAELAEHGTAGPPLV